LSALVDVNNDAVPGATVVLQGPALSPPRTILSNQNGFFQFTDVDPGTYQVTVSAQGFANWASPAIILQPGQYAILTGSKLHIAEALTTVTVFSGRLPKGDRRRAAQGGGAAAHLRLYPQLSCGI
jgi:hypothetical protein